MSFTEDIDLFTNLNQDGLYSNDFELDFCTDQQVPPYSSLDCFVDTGMSSARVKVEPIQDPYLDLDLNEILDFKDEHEMMSKSRSKSPSDAGYESNRDSTSESGDDLSDTKAVVVEPEHCPSPGSLGPHTQCSEDNNIELPPNVFPYDLEQVRETRDAVEILMQMTSEPRQEGILDQGEDTQYHVPNIKPELFPELSSSPSTSYLDSDSDESLGIGNSVLGYYTDSDRVMTVSEEVEIPVTAFAADGHTDRTELPIPQFKMLLDANHPMPDPDRVMTISEEVEIPVNTFAADGHVSRCKKLTPLTSADLPTYRTNFNLITEFGVSDAYRGHARHVSSSSSDDDDDNRTIMLDDLTDEEYTPKGGLRRAAKSKGRVSKTKTVRHWDATNGRRSRRKAPQLWVFLLDCLCEPSHNPSMIEWKDVQKGLFVLRDTKKISDLWGSRLDKHAKKPMTYDKFSRAIRYYYEKKVLLSHPSRLTYQFGPNATGWRAAANDSL